MLEDSPVQDRGAIHNGRLLVGLQQRFELLQLGPADDALQVHLLQNGIGGQVLATFVLEECGQHARTLLSSGGQDRADQSLLQRIHSLVLVDDRAVGQFVVALRGLNELPAVVEDTRIAHLVQDGELLELGVCLKQRGAVDVGLRLDGIVLLQEETRDLQIRLQFVVHGVLSVGGVEVINVQQRVTVNFLLLSRLQWDSNEDIRCLLPVLLSFVDIRQVLSNIRHLFLERDDPGLHLFQSEVGNDTGHIVRQFGQLCSHFREDLSGDDQTHLLVDNYGNGRDIELPY